MSQFFFCSRQTLLGVALSLGYFMYLFMGALMFQLLEKQAETKSRERFHLAKLGFLHNYTCLDSRAIEQFVQIIMEAWENGLNPKGNGTNPSNWDFSNSFFFAGTVITTIGYGNLYPSTMGGQVFCVFYALFGIPLNVAFLNVVGKGLHAHLVALGRCAKEPGGSGVMKALVMGLFLVTGSVFFLVFPPMIFSYVEGWSYSEGFYFAFITLSTIGFGDYVLGKDPNKHYISIYRSLAALWIIFGLAWLALVFNLVAEFVEKLIHWRMLRRHSAREEAAVQKTEDHAAQIQRRIPIPWTLTMTATCCRTRSCCCRVPVTLILLVIYFAYLLIGAAIFQALESQTEQTLTITYQKEKWELLKNHTCMDNRTLELFISGIINAYKSGINLQGNQSSQETWNYPGSFFFSVTAITTIGYGNIAPSTTGGRIFCVFFALFGIPLNIILLNRLGKGMLNLVQRCSNLLGNKIQRKKSVKILSSSVALIFGLLLFFLLPPILFASMEGWTYEEGFYYSFITLSTIGFGDYVIGREPDTDYPGWYRNIVAIWILLGMAWMALVINLCISLLENWREVAPCCAKQEYHVDQVLIEAGPNGKPASELKEKEALETSTAKATTLD
ncbi:uncharacterized protein PAF06_007990 [Gastrophryne carolinensis]